jgi:hypothetical protein
MAKPSTNTAAATVQTLIREVWASGSTIAQLTEFVGITKDQFIRLRAVLELPLRLDRSKRAKPPPQRLSWKTVEARKREIQAGWDAETEYQRRVVKNPDVVFRVVSFDQERADRSDDVERFTDLGDCK